jgi:hypothetical protein
MTKDAFIYQVLKRNLIKVDIKEGKVFQIRGSRGSLSIPREFKVNHNGYIGAKVSLNGEKKHLRLHRIIWIAANGIPPRGLCVCHKNNNKKDNKIDNLYLATSSQNLKDAARDGLMLYKNKSKFSTDTINKMKKEYKKSHKLKYLSEKYNISKVHLWRIVNNKMICQTS